MLDIRWTIKGADKPRGYKPEGLNKKSFGIVWLQYEDKIVKPPGFWLEFHHIMDIYVVNGGSDKAVRWHVSQRGNDKILTINERGRYRCPVPCCSEENPVHIVGEDKNCWLIEVVDINKPTPAYLPDYLCHRWIAYRGTKAYRTPYRYPLFFPGQVAHIQKKAIVGGA
jgi:hypothetical protein